jgi:hypothetical protein
MSTRLPAAPSRRAHRSPTLGALGAVAALLLASCGHGRPVISMATAPRGAAAMAPPTSRPSAIDAAELRASTSAPPAPSAEGQLAIDGPPPADPERPGLGTSWGEGLTAPISFEPFERASTTPWAEVVLHYNDADGAAAHAAYLGATPRPLEVPAGDGSLTVAIVDEAGTALPGVRAADRTLVLGTDGARYRILVRNDSPARFEVVASVDGLDVIDGQPADPARRGYLVEPHAVLLIDGFRTSDRDVAAFRFGRVADSYAAHSSGDRNVGVIGLALFPERGAVWTRAELQRRDTADPFPQRGYAAPPR